MRKINDITVNHNGILASLDVASLCSSIDAKEILKIIEESIDNIQYLSTDTLITLKSAINLITQSNVFIFNDKFYRQTEGDPMGVTHFRFNVGAEAKAFGKSNNGKF